MSVDGQSRPAVLFSYLTSSIRLHNEHAGSKPYWLLASSLMKQSCRAQLKFKRIYLRISLTSKEHCISHSNHCGVT